MSQSSKTEAPLRQVVASNRKARHDYHIEATWEAGLVLTGTEIKSVRAGCYGRESFGWKEST